MLLLCESNVENGNVALCAIVNIVNTYKCVVKGKIVIESFTLEFPGFLYEGLQCVFVA